MVGFPFDQFEYLNPEGYLVQWDFLGDFVWQQVVFYSPNSYVYFLNVVKDGKLHHDLLPHPPNHPPLGIQNRFFVEDQQKIVTQTYAYPLDKTFPKKQRLDLMQ